MVAHYAYNEQKNGLTEITIEHYDPAGLHGFMDSRMREQIDPVHFSPKDHGVLQKWVEPQGERNAAIRVLWSPQTTLVERRENKTKIRDSRVDVYERAVTFEGPLFLSEPLPLRGDYLNNRLNQAARSIAEHVAAVTSDRLKISRMALTFKVDSQNELWFLFATSIRLAAPPHPRARAVNLSPGRKQADREGLSRRSIMGVDSQTTVNLGSTFRSQATGSRPQTGSAYTSVQQESSLGDVAMGAGGGWKGTGAAGGAASLGAAPLELECRLKSPNFVRVAASTSPANAIDLQKSWTCPLCRAFVEAGRIRKVAYKALLHYSRCRAEWKRFILSTDPRLSQKRLARLGLQQQLTAADGLRLLPVSIPSPRCLAEATREDRCLPMQALVGSAAMSKRGASAFSRASSKDSALLLAKAKGKNFPKTLVKRLGYSAPTGGGASEMPLSTLALPEFSVYEEFAEGADTNGGGFVSPGKGGKGGEDPRREKRRAKSAGEIRSRRSEGGSTERERATSAGKRGGPSSVWTPRAHVSQQASSSASSTASSSSATSKDCYITLTSASLDLALGKTPSGGGDRLKGTQALAPHRTTGRFEATRKEVILKEQMRVEELHERQASRSMIPTSTVGEGNTRCTRSLSLKPTAQVPHKPVWFGKKPGVVLASDTEHRDCSSGLRRSHIVAAFQHHVAPAVLREGGGTSVSGGGDSVLGVIEDCDEEEEELPLWASFSCPLLRSIDSSSSSDEFPDDLCEDNPDDRGKGSNEQGGRRERRTKNVKEEEEDIIKSSTQFCWRSKMRGRNGEEGKIKKRFFGPASQVSPRLYPGIVEYPRRYRDESCKFPLYGATDPNPFTGPDGQPAEMTRTRTPRRSAVRRQRREKRRELRCRKLLAAVQESWTPELGRFQRALRRDLEENGWDHEGEGLGRRGEGFEGRGKGGGLKTGGIFNSPERTKTKIPFFDFLQHAEPYLKQLKEFEQKTLASGCGAGSLRTRSPRAVSLQTLTVSRSRGAHGASPSETASHSHSHSRSLSRTLPGGPHDASQSLHGTSVTTDGSFGKGGRRSSRQQRREELWAEWEESHKKQKKRDREATGRNRQEFSAAPNSSSRLQAMSAPGQSGLLRISNEQTLSLPRLCFFVSPETPPDPWGRVCA
uniref:Uncharacterized protein n=1 Tax=Chromera velia CCMP2878 TaxID=1169474 RepID=A0A0G4G9P8_9ALVE|eukprot:Cvel_20836.t1-p1 / transcript=Cvel_20836.t1 / gene=Cvel_20836 / organism=Chromera_velia_CCMP2878 / gene_product=hypothetical protein / transcript_product=hypothetical protein / location=Cvel_scaffold1906:19090-25735(-) / protein_length=1140 / sequence_SO=supercontig / SO=protein_coding / is_pseudo=false